MLSSLSSQTKSPTNIDFVKSYIHHLCIRRFISIKDQDHRYVHYTYMHQNYCIRTLPRGGMYCVVHPQRPRDFPRAEGNLEVGGDVQPNASRIKAVYGHSLIINPSLWMYQEIHTCRARSIDSVKINTFLIMMRECAMQLIQCNVRMW